MGAALFAMLATGRIKNMSDIKDLIPPQETVRPIPENHDLYKKLHKIFTGLYPRIEEMYGEMEKIRKEMESKGD
jgi:sugar (pentulose or hexulose) kinase